MLRPASAEFIELCQSQITLLTQSLGASLSAVYLTERYLDRSSTQPIPIAAYPDVAQPWNPSEPLALLPSDLQAQRLNRHQRAPVDTKPEPDVLPHPDRLILPLIEENMLMGFLVTQRNDRQWNPLEREQIQQITQTLTIACLLDQRAQWLEQRDRQQNRLQARQHDLLHNFLHQFRNPLTALRTFSKLLLKRLPVPDPSYPIAENMIRESDRLQHLLQELNQAIDTLDESIDESMALESSEPLLASTPRVAQLPPSSSLGSMSLMVESCAIEDILEPLLLSVEAIAQDRQLTLHQQIVPDLPLVDVNPSALTEVLNNLLENALKYTPPHGEIYVQVALHQNGDRLLIAISDTGPGIPPEDIDRIFDRHYRGIQGQSTISGTGLGLAIAKHLIEQMHGTIKAFSPAAYPPHATQGSTFIVSLPIP